MDLLVERIQHPGKRRKTSLKFPTEAVDKKPVEEKRASQQPVGSGLAAAIDLKRRNSGNVSPNTGQGTQDNRLEERKEKGGVTVPAISVNDETVYNPGGPVRRASQDRRPSFHHARTAKNNDYSAASAGMFSDCMFENKASKVSLVPRTHGSAGSSSSSSSSLCTYGSHKTSYMTEQLKRMPTANVELSPQITNSMPAEPAQSRTPIHRSHVLGRRDSGVLHKRHQRSFSGTTAHDGKRLVYQFLRSMDSPLPANPSTLHFSKPSKEAYGTSDDITTGPLADYDLPTNGSLQNLLYRDLETLRKKKGNELLSSPYHFNGKSSSSELSSQPGFYENTTPLSSSASFHSSRESVSLYGSEKSEPKPKRGRLNSTVPLNYNEVDYYRRHIGSELHKFEEILKYNLKEILMKNESGMQKNLSKFDSLTEDLMRLKNRATELHDEFKNKDLVKLRKDFDKNDQESFLKVVTTSMKDNAAQLEELEKRINVSRQKLFQQRDTLRKLEGLLTLEDSLLDSKRTSKVAYRYRYIIFDLGAFLAMICLAAFIKWLFWR